MHRFGETDLDFDGLVRPVAVRRGRRDDLDLRHRGRDEVAVRIDLVTGLRRQRRNESINRVARGILDLAPEESVRTDADAVVVVVAFDDLVGEEQRLCAAAVAKLRRSRATADLEDQLQVRQGA